MASFPPLEIMLPTQHTPLCLPSQISPSKVQNPACVCSQSPGEAIHLVFPFELIWELLQDRILLERAFND